MISKETIAEALSKIDQKYVDQTVDYTNAPEENTHARAVKGRSRSAGLEVAVVILLIAAGILAGILIARRTNKKHSGPSMSAPTEVPQDPTPTEVPLEMLIGDDCRVFHIPDLAELIYAGAEAPLKTLAPGATTAPGAKTDVDMLPRAFGVLRNETIAVLFEDEYGIEGARFLNPVFSLHRDEDGSGGYISSGSIVLMMCDEASETDGTASRFRYVMIEGHVDDVDNAILRYDESGKVCAGPLTVNNVFIIDAFDGLYPSQALYGVEHGLALSQLVYPLYDGINYPAELGQPEGEEKVRINGKWADAVGQIMCVSLGSGDSWVVQEYNATLVNIDPFIDTYRRFGLDYLERIKAGTVDYEYRDDLKTSKSRFAAFLSGYPSFIELKSYIWMYEKCQYVGIERTEHGVKYQYLLKYDDGVVLVSTPELYQSGYWDTSGWPELVYDISIHGQWYTVASDDVTDTRYPKLSDAERSAGFADQELFSVKGYSSSEFDSAVNEMKRDSRFSAVMTFKEFLSAPDEVSARATARPDPGATEAPH